MPTLTEARDNIIAQIIDGAPNTITPSKLRQLMVDMLDALDAEVPFFKFDATAPPTANDDGANTSGNGTFAIGSRWIDLVGDAVYICTDASTGNANWVSAGSVAPAWGLITGTLSNQTDLQNALDALGLRNMQVFTASGTYTPSSNDVDNALIITTGAGGAGGAGNSTANAAAGGGGGAGATALWYRPIANTSDTATITIGAGGTCPSVSSAGNNGGNTVVDFGGNDSMTCAGGKGGNYTADSNAGGGGTSVCTPGASITGVNAQFDGAQGDDSIIYDTGGGSNNQGLGAAGGASFWGGGASALTFTGAGITATAKGAGGGGGKGTGGSDFVGGSGADGVVIILEYS